MDFDRERRRIESIQSDLHYKLAEPTDASKALGESIARRQREQVEREEGTLNALREVVDQLEGQEAAGGKMLWWARVAGVAGVLGVLVAVVALIAA